MNDDTRSFCMWSGFVLFLLTVCWGVYQHYQHATRAAAIAAGLVQIETLDGRVIWTSKESAELEAQKTGTRFRF